MTAGDVFYSRRWGKASEERTLGQRPREKRKGAGSCSGGDVQAEACAEAQKGHIPGVFPKAARTLTGWAE